jgi:hypothetical protein
LTKKLFWLIILAVAFAYIEAAIVIYLRHIYYPEGFGFPLKLRKDYILAVEVMREFATLVILVSAGILLSKKFWEGFAYFLIMFGVWDIFFYVWLKLLIGWPGSIFEWDVLFLIPMPWIAPVIAPVSLSLIMVVIGVMIVRLFDKGYNVLPGLMHWVIVLIGCGFIFYSFMNDFDAAFFQKIPRPFHYEMLIVGEILLIISFYLLYKKVIQRLKDSKIQRIK